MFRAALTQKHVPENAHTCVVFLTSSQIRHEIVFTDKNLQGLEQWIELLIRFYLYDRTHKARLATKSLLIDNREFISDIIKSVFDFERILFRNENPRLAEHESEMYAVVDNVFEELTSYAEPRDATVT